MVLSYIRENKREAISIGLVLAAVVGYTLCNKIANMIDFRRRNPIRSGAVAQVYLNRDRYHDVVKTINTPEGRVIETVYFATPGREVPFVATSPSHLSPEEVEGIEKNLENPQWVVHFRPNGYFTEEEAENIVVGSTGDQNCSRKEYSGSIGFD